MNIRSHVPEPIKKALRPLLGRANPVISPKKKFGPDEEDEFRWVRDTGISTVIDIGAHSGDFSKQYRAILPNAMIYAFEPLPGPFSLMMNAMAGDERFKAFQCALGEQVGKFEMSENEFTYSSSLLSMADRHRAEFPFTTQTNALSVDVKRLDDFKLGSEGKTLIKIDVQGFEDRVINGGEKTVKSASVVVLEVSFVELYKGQPLFAAIYDRMRDLGFSYAGNLSQLRSPANGLPLQQDAIFLRA